MKLNRIIGMLAILCSLNNWAGSFVDIYGARPEEAALLMKQYSKKIEQMEQALSKQTSAPVALQNEQQISALLRRREVLKKQLKKQFGFLYVDFQNIFYPNTQTSYTTVEVIRSDQSWRLRFIPHKKQEPEDLQTKSDLIAAMIRYQTESFELVVSKKISITKKVCPVYHCFVGFENPKLRPYLTLFNQGVIQQKKLILDVLQRDPSSIRREAAALLLGHFKDPQEIIKIASEYIQDKSPGVRNNVMRVLGATMDKAKVYDLDLRPVIEMLDSPITTDRNKALFILFVALGSKVNQSFILQHAGKQLLALLALKQPNNHDYAYDILKKLHHRPLGEYELVAWGEWLKQKHSQSPKLMTFGS